MLVHHVEAGRAEDVPSKCWMREGHDPDLREPPGDSWQPEGELAWHFKKHETALGGSLEDLAHQDSRESDMLQDIAVDDQVGFASSRISGCDRRRCGRNP